LGSSKTALLFLDAIKRSFKKGNLFDSELLGGKLDKEFPAA
jgi:hypothetical protein